MSTAADKDLCGRDRPKVQNHPDSGSSTQTGRRLRQWERPDGSVPGRELRSARRGAEKSIRRKSASRRTGRNCRGPTTCYYRRAATRNRNEERNPCSAPEGFFWKIRSVRDAQSETECSEQNSRLRLEKMQCYRTCRAGASEPPTVIRSSR